MSKKQSTRRSVSGQGTAKDTPHHDWLAPVSDSMPCGPDLEEGPTILGLGGWEIRHAQHKSAQER